ncbi:hypothetical protein AMTR_s00092p00130040 [Amborella trichopoda]|uniref:Uncharacterized protein n=1 Tax=Amborella trichopoda TaxID=13333 RepID=W1NUI0_AMBTC|nr:hypothetical protein AMTR_s00092p00130040 [Amborella trichopoda]
MSDWRSCLDSNDEIPWLRFCHVSTTNSCTSRIAGPTAYPFLFWLLFWRTSREKIRATFFIWWPFFKRSRNRIEVRLKFSKRLRNSPRGGVWTVGLVIERRVERVRSFDTGYWGRNFGNWTKSRGAQNLDQLVEDKVYFY